MSRHLAHRPRHQMPPRTYQSDSQRFHQAYLPQRWTYRQQRQQFPRHPLGYGLANLPWGWRGVRNTFLRRA